MMDIKTYGWRTIALDIYVISLFCALLLFVRSVHKTYKYGEYNESFPIIQQMIAAVLVLIGLAGNNLKSLPNWIYIISPICVHYSLLISYVVHQQVFYNKLVPIVKNKHFIITTFLSAISIYVGLYAGDISISFVNDEDLSITPSYFAYYSLRSLISLYLEIITVWIIFENLWQHRSLTHIVRRYADLFLFLSFTVTSLTVEINLFHILLDGGTYRRHINDIFFAGLGVAGLLIPIVLMPQELLVRIVQPIENRIKKREEEYLNYLHDVLVRIVKCVQYRPDKLQNQRKLVELEQAHYILWTHEPKVKAIKPRDSVAYIFTCLQNNIEFNKAGPCVPPPTHLDMDRHLLSVAKQLRELEHRYYIKSRLPHSLSTQRTSKR